METIINNELFDVFMEWEKTSGLRIVAHDNSLSMPFIPYASNEYAASQKKLLIVGQEARDYPPFDDNWHKQQICVNEYFESQLHGKKLISTIVPHFGLFYVNSNIIMVGLHVGTILIRCMDL